MAAILRKSALLSVLALCACANGGAAPDGPLPEAPIEIDQTLILDRVGNDRFTHLQGITLQWIGWDERGQVTAGWRDRYLHLTGTQAEANGPGRLFLEGRVTEIGKDYFTLEGVIRITDTPDRGRHCEADKLWHFAVTQDRKYYRLREFEWCDGLTDYVDIYF